MMISLPIRRISPMQRMLPLILIAPFLGACAGAYSPPGARVVAFADPYQFPFEAPGFGPNPIRTANYTQPSGIASPPQFIDAGDTGGLDFDHDLMVAAGGYVIGRTGERLLGRAFKPAAPAIAGGSSAGTPLGTGRMMGWEMLAADGAPAAAASRTAMSGAGSAAEKAVETAGTAVAAETAVTRGALSAGTREATAISARTAVGTAGRATAAAVGAGEAASAAEAATVGRTALTVGRAAGVARTAMGAGAVLEAGAAVGAAEVLVGAAVVAGTAYVAYKLYESYREGKRTPSTP